jgi:adenylyl-sulfate kinase
MIYYTNTNIAIPHMMFIGRWAPFHRGHTAIMLKKLKENPKAPLLILVRNTAKEAFAPSIRAEYIKTWMIENKIKGTIMIIPDIDGVYWGRGVGYKTELVDVDAETKQISGTQIRNKLQAGDPGWTMGVASQESSYILSSKISSILEHGIVVWLTGCPSSGKTTIANALLQDIHARYPYLKTQLLDGDDMRASPLAQHVGFSPKERAEHIIRMAYLAKLFADHGVLVVCAFVSPDRSIREKVKKMIGNRRYIEVYVKASKKIRMKRDTKGMYKKALAGKLQNFTGLNAPYEIPLHPSVVCDTEKLTLGQCVSLLHRFISKDNLSRS